MIGREEKAEQRKAEITLHFKKQKRKAILIWLAFEIAAISASLLLTKIAFDTAYLHWFLISLFFIFVFPVTVLSKKLKALNLQEREQKKFAEIE